ncbi:MAG: fold metallo-hydrolase [Mycobacterium sp.]|nr:fold metallo-hydrolase [Mycobacterium sp.]
MIGTVARTSLLLATRPRRHRPVSPGLSDCRDRCGQISELEGDRNTAQAPDRGYRVAIQTWVLRVGRRTILVDTGIGNDRQRPQMPVFAGLQTVFLQRLSSVGVNAADVDLVVNTHIHADHVGWNTRLEGDTFVPTFPNATYLIPQRDYDYFRPDNAEKMRPPRSEDERWRFEGSRLVLATASPRSWKPAKLTGGTASTGSVTRCVSRLPQGTRPAPQCSGSKAVMVLYSLVISCTRRCR